MVYSGHGKSLDGVECVVAARHSNIFKEDLIGYAMLFAIFLRNGSIYTIDKFKTTCWEGSRKYVLLDL
jgi:hypothetical protein